MCSNPILHYKPVIYHYCGFKSFLITMTLNTKPALLFLLSAASGMFEKSRMTLHSRRDKLGKFVDAYEN